MYAQKWKAGIWVWLSIALVAWLFFCPAIAVSFSENPQNSNYVLIPSMGPVVFGTNQNSTTVGIVAHNDCIPVIRYANNSFFSISQYYDHEISSLSHGRNHTIRITNLEPATKYHYNVSGCGLENIDRSFSTYPASGSCTFIVYGDTREQAPLYTQTERHKIVADHIAQEKGFLFVINSGDLVSNSTDPSEWSRFFNATEKIRSMTTYTAIPGNHDTDRLLFRQLFGEEGPDYFDCGAARIILLDSTDMSSMTMIEQAQWLSNVKNVGQRVTIVILHHPMYSSEEKHYGGYDDLQRVLVHVFQEYGVRLVFNSHVHAFEQVNRDGITYITEGRGGAPAYFLNPTRIPGSVKSLESSLGYSRVTVGPAGEIMIDAIRVADVSSDLRTVTKVYAPDTIDTKISIPSGDAYAGFTGISVLKCFQTESEGNHGCLDPLVHRKIPSI